MSMKICCNIRAILFISCLAVLFLACNQKSSKERVVIYTSIDQIFSEPILDAFEEQTGIEVLAVYDVEASKTTGLVNRLISERESPRADVWWNSEIIQTIVLKQAGILTPYMSSDAKFIPDVYRDPDNYWTGIGGRARVLIVNTDLVEQPDAITSIFDLLDPRWDAEEIAVANPLFGTSVTHAAALYAYLGLEEGFGFYESLAERGVNVVEGNSVVRDLVANGSLAFGLTDTDDACGALLRGDPVDIIIPDQGGIGTLVIPGTVALIEGAPHPDQGKILVDYLLSTQVERQLVENDFIHIPLRSDVEVNDTCISTLNIRSMDVDFAQVFDFLDVSQSELREIFLR